MVPNDPLKILLSGAFFYFEDVLHICYTNHKEKFIKSHEKGEYFTLKYGKCDYKVVFLQV